MVGLIAGDDGASEQPVQPVQPNMQCSRHWACGEAEPTSRPHCMLMRRRRTVKRRLQHLRNPADYAPTGTIASLRQLTDGASSGTLGLGGLVVLPHRSGPHAAAG